MKKVLKRLLWDTWVSQSIECLTSAQVTISLFVGSSPTSGSVLPAQSLEPLQILCLPLSRPLPGSHSFCLSLKNKHFKKLKKERDYREQLYATKLGSLGEMGKFPGTHNLPGLNHEEGESLNSPTTNMDTEPIIKNLPTNSGQCNSKPQQDITSFLPEWPRSKTQETRSVDDDVEKKQPSCTVSADAIWCSHRGKQHRVSSKSQK